MSTRIGIFGGSFDPVHYGHLLLAEICREQCGLDEVWWMPAAVPPHKQHRPLTPAKARLEMLDLAVAGHEAFRVSSMELDRQGVSYTVDTLTQLHAERPDAEWFFLLGSDTLADLPTWREPDRICELAVLVCVRRAGSPEADFGVLGSIASDERIREFQRHQVEMPLIGSSSSDLRQRIADGRSIRFQTPRAVEKYIETHQLYRPTRDERS